MSKLLNAARVITRLRARAVPDPTFVEFGRRPMTLGESDEIVGVPDDFTVIRGEAVDLEPGDYLMLLECSDHIVVGQVEAVGTLGGAHDPITVTLLDNHGQWAETYSVDDDAFILRPAV